MRTSINGYIILDELIGSGGFSKVWKGYKETDKNIKVAIKQLLIEDDKMVPYIKNEIAALQSLSKFPACNEHILCIYDYVQLGNVVYIISEYIDGEVMSNIPSKKLRDVNSIKNIFTQCILVLEYIHSKGILHRDIKPENIMITHLGIVKFIDFGIACSIPDKFPEILDTCSGISGTRNYMDPNIFKGIGNIYYESDIYSLGATMYSFITETPFDNITISYNTIKTTMLKYTQYAPINNYIIHMLNPDIQHRPTAIDIVNAITSGNPIVISPKIIQLQKPIEQAEYTLSNKDIEIHIDSMAELLDMIYNNDLDEFWKHEVLNHYNISLPKDVLEHGKKYLESKYS